MIGVPGRRPGRVARPPPACQTAPCVSGGRNQSPLNATGQRRDTTGLVSHHARYSSSGYTILWWLPLRTSTAVRHSKTDWQAACALPMLIHECATMCAANDPSAASANDQSQRGHRGRVACWSVCPSTATAMVGSTLWFAPHAPPAEWLRSSLGHARVRGPAPCGPPPRRCDGYPWLNGSPAVR